MDTAAQQLAGIIGLPTKITTPNGLIVALRDFSIRTEGSRVLRVTAEYGCYARWPVEARFIPVIKHYTLVEDKG